jgi:hypothetical protein
MFGVFISATAGSGGSGLSGQQVLALVSGRCDGQTIDVVSFAVAGSLPPPVVIHDPASQRIAMRDPNTGRVRVYGYDSPGGPITLRAITLAPNGFDEPFCTSYDAANRVIWNRGTPLPFDLSRF